MHKYTFCELSASVRKLLGNYLLSSAITSEASAEVALLHIMEVLEYPEAVRACALRRYP